MFRLTSKQAQKKLARNLYKKPGCKPSFWNKNQVDKQVFQLLFDYANVPDSKVLIN
jgi:hypothetical protein